MIDVSTLKPIQSKFWTAPNSDKVQLSPWEQLKNHNIQAIEQEQLDRVFNYLISQDSKKDQCNNDKIGPNDLMKVLTYLGLKLLRSEVALYIWEVDDDLDGYISKEEFQIMYKRSVSDKTGLEPRKLFNLVQYLMYDRNFKGRVTIEETLQILFVRHGRDKLDYEIEAIFGTDEKNTDGSEKSINFEEYLKQVNQRALDEYNDQVAQLRTKKRIEVDGGTEDK